MHPVWRAVGVVALLAAVAGLCVHYGATAEDHHPYPTTDDLATNYDAYVGEDVRLFGTVESVDDAADRGAIRVESGEGDFRMTVREFDARVRPGGVVQVYGRLEADRTIAATSVAVVNPADGSKTYKYVVSAVGAALAVVLFFRHWRVDPSALAFEPKTDRPASSADAPEVSRDG
ncbi:MAG: hypothetical protein ABEJ26_04600 [Halosimplex sp.]